MQENLGQRVADVGGSSRDGSTRGKLAEERDKTWLNLSRRDLSCTQRKTDQTDQSGLGSNETSCLLHDFTLCLAPKRVLRVLNFQKVPQRLFVSLHLPVLNRLAKLSEALRWSTIMARRSNATSPPGTSTGGSTTRSR